jgi:cytochrome c-type biogenesis protein
MPLLASAGLSTTVYSGPLIVAAGVAMLVGLIGFLSPCVLPLVPGYLSYVAGLAGTGDEPKPRRMLAGAALFVLGFTAVFVALGALFGSLGSAIADHLLLLERIFGVWAFSG